MLSCESFSFLAIHNIAQELKTLTAKIYINFLKKTDVF